MLQSDWLPGLLDALGEYCILHDPGEGDLDIAARAEARPALEAAVQAHPELSVIRYLDNVTSHYFVLADRQDRFFCLDLVQRLHQAGLLFFSPEEMLAGRVRQGDYWWAAPAVELRYTLYKALLKGNLNAAKWGRLQQQWAAQQTELEEMLTQDLGPRAAQSLAARLKAEVEASSSTECSSWRQALRQRGRRRRPWLPLQSAWVDLRRRAAWLRHPAGLSLALLGPDGAGKSTLLKGLTARLQPPAFPAPQHLHFRPNLLGRRSRGDVAAPHSQAPRGRLASAAKLGLYLLDYTFGYALSVIPALLRGRPVLFDRYFNDLAVDPRRYRYGGPRSWLDLAQRLIPRPDLLLVLDAPVTALQARKQEVAAEEAARQRQGYLRLVSAESRAFLLDVTRSPEEVQAQALSLITEALAQRYPRRGQANDLDWLAEAVQVAIDGDGPANHRWLALPGGRSCLLPLQGRRAARLLAALYRPQSGRARLWLAVMTRLLRLGLGRWLGKSVMLRPGSGGHLAAALAAADVDLADSGLALGTPGAHRKAVLAAGRGNERIFAKLVGSAVTASLIDLEAAALEALPIDGQAFQIPQLLDHKAGSYLLQAAPPQVQPAPQSFAPHYRRALESLAAKAAPAAPLAQTHGWRRLQADAREIKSRYWRALVEQEMDGLSNQLGGQPLPQHAAHGDLAPWNAGLVAGELYLFDWEYYQAAAPAGYDLFHFHSQCQRLLQGSSPAESLRACLEAAARPALAAYRRQAGLSDELIRPLLRLYLLERLATYAARQSEDYDSLQYLAAMLAGLRAKDLA